MRILQLLCSYLALFTCVSATTRTVVVSCVNASNKCHIVSADPTYFTTVVNNRDGTVTVAMAHCPRMACEARLVCDNVPPVLINKNTAHNTPVFT